MKYLLVVAVITCASCAFAQGAFPQQVAGLPPYIEAPLSDAGTGYFVGPSNPALRAFPSNIRERRVLCFDVAALACRYALLINRFGRSGQAVMGMCGLPGNLPEGCSGWFTWGNNDRIQVSWSVVTPEQSVAMPGWIIDLGDGWFIHLQLGVGNPRYGQNVIAFYGKWDTTWRPPPFPALPAPREVVTTQLPALCLELVDVTATATVGGGCGGHSVAAYPGPVGRGGREVVRPGYREEHPVGSFDASWWNWDIPCVPEYPDYTPTLPPH